MPRRISRSGSQAPEEDNEVEYSDGVIMGDAYTPSSSMDMPDDFEFPGNLSDLTWDEREDLRRRHARHYSSRMTADVSPSRIINPDTSPRRTRHQVSAPPEIVETQEDVPVGPDGYVVEGEDARALMARGVPPDEAYKLANRAAKPIKLTHADVFERKMSSMSRLEREAEERFGNI